MSIYKKLTAIGLRFFPKYLLFKYGFNLSPMYRRSTGRLTTVSEDLLKVRMKLRISYKNRNYVNSIFGGSMFSAVDPIPMIQLLYILGDEYVVWDKSAEVFFKRPGRENLYADFEYSIEELQEIKDRVKQEKEIDIIKTTYLTNQNGNVIFCEIKKTMYVADKSYYKEKRRLKNQK